MTRTGKNAALRKSAPDPILEINRADARHYNIHDADFVEVTSRRGKVMAQCRVTEEIASGSCFLPFHWGRDYGFFKAANNLTISARDPVSRQPELKACAVRVRKVLRFSPGGQLAMTAAVIGKFIWSAPDRVITEAD